MPRFTMLQYVQICLERSHIPDVSREVGIPVRTLYAILRGEFDPAYSRVERLYLYFRRGRRR